VTQGAQDTRWSLIHDAARGEAAARTAFARAYEPVIRAYLGARWRGSPLVGEIDDAVQEVFVDCFKDAGALERVDPARGPGFRAFLRGVVRNVALRAERSGARRKARPGSAAFDADRVATDEDALSTVFDRAWAKAVVRQAAALQVEHARAKGDGALRRVELLRLRFEEGLPVRTIADRWGAEPTDVHRAYARARREFEVALREVVTGVHPGSKEEVRAECLRILRALA
jgi:RNA polymerase sigma-70 factor (ECF subfamily)